MFSARRVYRVFFCILIVLGLLFAPNSVQAVVSSCTANVSPTSVNTSTTATFTFTIQNTDSVTFRWIKISRPSSNFTITSYSVGGWSGSVTSSDVTFTGGTLTASGSNTFNVEATSGSSETASANWTVQASDDSGGASPFSCSGTLGTSISGSAPDTTAPSISNIVVSDVTDTSVKITWDTDESSNSSVDYGTTDSYGSNAANSSMTTSHSVNISGLSANTTYHYNAKSTDGSSNEAESGDNTFVTAKSGSTGTTQTGVTRTVTATPTPTPIPDKTPPNSTITTKFDKPFVEAPTIEGKATDGSGVTEVEYSIDDGRNWSKVDDLIGAGKSSVTFVFTPVGLEDGNYDVKVRATDGKSNRGESKVKYTMIIDRLPPLVGGSIVAIGPQILAPRQDGALLTVSGLKQKLTLSAVGGPTEIIVKSKKENGKSAAEEIVLTKNIDNGLWSGELSFSEPGTYILSTHAVDGAKNETDRDIGTVIVVASGAVVSGDSPVTHARVEVFAFDTTSLRFTLWDGSSYGLPNPQPVDESGRYSLFLPAGTYYLQVKAGGYKPVKTTIFTLDGNTPITADFSLDRQFTIVIGPLVIPLPSFKYTTTTLNFDRNDEPIVRSNNPLLSKEFPFFRFTTEKGDITTNDWKGKTTVLTFLNSWAPQAAQQLTILNELSTKREINVAAIVPQESVAHTIIFGKRGGYSLPIVADPDGELVEPLNLHTIPTHVFLDRKGVVERVMVGVMTKEEILDTLIK